MKAEMNFRQTERDESETVVRPSLLHARSVPELNVEIKGTNPGMVSEIILAVRKAMENWTKWEER